MADRKTLYIIDGHAQIFRAYHAIRSGMTSPVTQEPTNATFGFVGMLVSVPACAVIGVLVRFAIGRYRESAIYLGSGG